MVKASGSGGTILSRIKQSTAKLRVGMKRKLSLPTPFMVSRGYTPEYPWLGQQHPGPDGDRSPGKAGGKKLLMQQSAGFWKTVLFVACVAGGLVLIAYAGQAIVRGHTGLPERGHYRGGALPQQAALVQDDYSEYVDTDTVELVAPLAVPAPSAASEGLEDAASMPQQSLPIVIRLVDPVDAAPALTADPTAVEVEAAPAVAVDSAVEAEAAPALNAALAALEAGTEGVPAVSDDALSAMTGEEAAVDEVGVAAAPAIQALQAGKQMLLLMRLANLVGAQRELTARVRVTDALQEAYDELQTAEDAINALAGLAPEPAHSDELEDEPTLFHLLADEQAGQEEGAHQEPAPREQHQDDAEAMLQWLWSNGEAWNEDHAEVPQEDSEQGVDEEQQRRDILQWFWTHGQAWNEQQEEDRLRGEDNDEPKAATEPEAPVQAARQLGDLSQAEDHAETVRLSGVLPWDQLNEDDKQDTVLPQLAARGLDLDAVQMTERGEDETTHASELETPDDVHLALVAPPDHLDEARAACMHPHVHEDVVTDQVVPWTPFRREDDTDDDVPLTQPEVLHDVHLSHIVPRKAVAVPDAPDALHEQQHDLLARRVPLMYHVLQLRREQQLALQQEQRATAYLRLLDLHLLQHQQEAGVRHALHQHDQDERRLDAYARQLGHSQWLRQGQSGTTGRLDGAAPVMAW